MIQPKPLPPAQAPIVAALAPSQPYYQYWQALDQIIRGTLAAGINTQTANYTLALSDILGVIEMNLAGANTLTIPPNNTIPFPIGTFIPKIVQAGAGATTLTAGAGVTIRSRLGLQLAGQWAVASLYKRGTNEWVASGDLT